MRIGYNSNADRATNMLAQNLKQTNKSLERLATGLRINKAGDDAAGLAISEKMRAQIRGLNMSVRNATDAISLIQTAEGALQEDHAILQRMRELTVQAANDTNTTEDRHKIAQEVSGLVMELDNTFANTEFNTKKIFLGANTDAFVFQVGANEGQTVELYIKRSRIPTLAYFGSKVPALMVGGPGDEVIFDLTSNAKANTFLTVVDKAIENVSKERANLGAMQNRLEHTVANVANAAENLTGAESRIRDADLAQEMVLFAKEQILQQTGTAMLAQANQTPQSILRLLTA